MKSQGRFDRCSRRKFLLQADKYAQISVPYGLVGSGWCSLAAVTYQSRAQDVTSRLEIMFQYRWVMRHHRDGQLKSERVLRAARAAVRRPGRFHAEARGVGPCLAAPRPTEPEGGAPLPRLPLSDRLPGVRWVLRAARACGLAWAWPGLVRMLTRSSDFTARSLKYFKDLTGGQIYYIYNAPATPSLSRPAAAASPPPAPIH